MLATARGQTSTTWGYVYFAGRTDTVHLSKARVAIYEHTLDGPGALVADQYSNDQGKFIFARLPYGRYFIQVYFGSPVPLMIGKPGGREALRETNIDRPLVRLPTFYVSNP